MNSQQKILLASPHMGGSEMKYVQLAFDTNWVAPLGANVTGFEQDLCAYTGSPFGVALSSGTAALHLALIQLGVRAGDTVFCQDLTFSASANPICYLGAKPVFIDSEPNTWNMDPDALTKAFELYGRPKAVLCVHLYGTPAKINAIKDVCDAYDTPLLEDAAEALGSFSGGKACGTFGAYGVLSFNGNKIITTSGGGMLLCKNREDAEHVLKLATQARDRAPWYQHTEIGYNYRLSNICAGIGRGQMEVLALRVQQKNAIFERYRDAFSDLPVSWAEPENGAQSNRWLSAMIIDAACSVTPQDILDALSKKNAEGRYMWKPMHMQPVFANCPYVASSCSVSEMLFARGVCLPSDSKMTAEQQEMIIETVRSLFDVRKVD